MLVSKTSELSSNILLLVIVLGYKLLQGANGCGNDTSLYFVDEHNIKCIELWASNHTYVKVHTVKSGLVQAGAIDIDYRDRTIYWSDNALWTLNRMNLDTFVTEVTIREDLGQVDGLAVEWGSGLIYWTDYIFERIEVAKMNGTSRKTLISRNLYGPRGIAVDPNRGLMFWTDSGFALGAKVERADLTGENRHRLVRMAYQRFPISLVIDPVDRYVYWMDENYLQRCDFNGRHRVYLLYIKENINPVDLTMYEEIIYWVDKNSRSIHWLNTTELRRGMGSFGHLTDDTLVGAVVSDKSRQPKTLAVNSSSCRLNNGGCSHLCLLAPRQRYKCACPNGVQLGSNQKTCSNVTSPGPPPRPVPDVKVRLRGSASSNEGRVEVYHHGRWGTICDDLWRLREATVVCRMLNFSAAVKVVKNSYRYYGRVNNTYVIWMDNVKCRGDESTIAACRHPGWNVHDCSHFEDVGIKCKNDTSPSNQGPTLAPGLHPELKVRLSSGTTHNQGRVELFLNGSWGTICDDYWGIEEANVICRMMNFSEGAWSTQCCGWYYQYSRQKKIWLDDVHCVGDEQSIAGCRHGGWGNHDCDHSEDVGVVCKYTPVVPDETLRLVDGYRDGEGRVEISHDRYWGTVCDDYWNLNDAQVVCRQLGYSAALGAPHRAFFGAGNGHIWLDNVRCLGNESSIEDCGHIGWNVHNCVHREDASVICSNATDASLYADDFLLSCERGRKLCYFIKIQPGPFSKPHITPLKFESPSTCSSWPLTATSYDPVENMIFWTDGCGGIYKGFLKSGMHRVVVRDTIRVMDIEVDPIGRNIYFSEQSSHTIRVAAIDGPYQAVLVKVQSPQGLALDIESRFMYFSSISYIPRIFRADMDGNNKILLANLTNAGWTSIYFALDKRGNRLFFSERSNSVIRYIDLGSMEIRSLISGNLHGPASLAMLNNTLYWTSEGTGKFTGAIFKAEATNSSEAKMIADGFYNPGGICAHAHSHITSQKPVQSSCQNNGGCSQLCVLIPSGRRCLCQPGMRIANDNKTCEIGDVIFVADTGKAAIYVSSLYPLGGAQAPLPLENISYPYRIAFNPLESRIYWIEIATGVISRSSGDGKNRENIQSNLFGLRGIALDIVGGNVYWISSRGYTIEVSKLNGNYWKVLISNLREFATNIVLDATRGYMYWSDDHRIHRAELDGENQEVLATSLYYANGMAMDVKINRLYFIVHNYRSRVSYLDLQHPTLSVKTLISWSSYYWWYSQFPTSIAVDEHHVYFGLYRYGDASNVYRINKKIGNSSLELVLGGFSYPSGIAVYTDNATQNSHHPCAKNNGGCTHLCLIKPSGYSCACPTLMGDGRPCSTSNTSTVTTTPTKRPVPDTPSTTKPLTTAFDYCASFQPCENSAKCEMVGGDYKCLCAGYYGGKNCSVYFSKGVVDIYIREVEKETFNKTAFNKAIAEVFNDFCSGEFSSQCSGLRKRANSTDNGDHNQIRFRPEDIYIPSDLKKGDNGIVIIECAVVKTTRIPMVVPSDLLSSMIKKKAAEIGRKLNVTVVTAVPKTPQNTNTPTGQYGTNKQNSGVIAGVTVTLGLTVIVVAIVIWYLRVRAKRGSDVPYKNTEEADNKSDVTRRVVSFENPGFGNVGTVGGGDMSSTTFSPFEEEKQTSVYSNPLYTEEPRAKLSTSLTKSKNAADIACKNVFRAGKAVERPMYLELAATRDNSAKEEAHYASLTSNKIEEQNEKVKIEDHK